MNKLELLSQALKKFNPEEVILTILRDIEPQLIDLNTNQLFSGVDSKGFLLKPPYADINYKDFKQTLNPKGVVDLKLTGDFYDGFFAKVDKFPLVFGSTDEKSSELESKYGKDIFGLSKNSLTQIGKGTIAPEYIKELRKILELRGHTA